MTFDELLFFNYEMIESKGGATHIYKHPDRDRYFKVHNYWSGEVEVSEVKPKKVTYTTWVEVQ